MLLSVIIPVYNVEKYIRRCLDSLVGQMDSNMEIICIDDGSTDNSYIICQEYATNNQNFYVYSKENGGVASARNLGLTKTKGKYVAWVDSDDYVANDWGKTIVELLKKEQPDCLLFDYYNDHYGKIEEVHTGFPYIISQEKFIFELSLDVRLKNILMFKVIKRNLYQGLKFDEKAIVLEDYKLLTYLALKVKKVISTSNCLYYYVRRANSLTNNANMAKRLLSADIAKERYELYQRKGLRISKASLWKMAVLACISKKNGSGLSKQQKDAIKVYEKLLHKDLIKILGDSNVEKEVKVAILFNQFIPNYISAAIWDFIRKIRYEEE